MLPRRTTGGGVYVKQDKGVLRMEGVRVETANVDRKFSSPGKVLDGKE